MSIVQTILKPGNNKKIIQTGTKITVNFVGRIKDSGVTFAESKPGKPITLVVG